MVPLAPTALLPPADVDVFLLCSLATVNFFLFCTGATQVTRIFLYNRSLKGDTIQDEAVKAAKDERDALKSAAEDAKEAVKA